MFKYLGFVLDTSSIDVAECHMKVVSRREVEGAIKCARVFHETLLVPFLLYGNETMMTVQMDNLIGLLGIRRMDEVLNAQIREWYGMGGWKCSPLSQPY